MGNFLETCNLDNLNLDGERDRKSREAAAEAHFYLSDVEKEHLWANFNQMFSSSKKESIKETAGSKVPKAPSCTPQLEAFVKVLTKNYHPHLAEVIFDYVLAKSVHSYPAFESFVIDCARISSSRSLEMVFEIAHYGSSSHPQLTDRTLLGKLCYLLYLLAVGPSTASNEDLLAESSKLEDFYINAHLKMHGKENPNVEFSELISITQAYFPHAIKAFQTYFCLQLLHSDESPSYKPFRPLQLIDKSEIVSSEQLASLAMHSDDLQGGWKRLYSSATDGLSFNRVVHHILGYEGPTCFLIRCSNDEHSIMGFFCGTRWRETNRFYGTSKNLLFTMTPRLRVYRSKNPSNQSYQWLNQKAYALPHGLGIGGTLDGFRIFIPESLEDCIAHHDCPTFEPGPLLPKGDRFEIDALEVWAVGGIIRVQQGLRAQELDREVSRENIDKARKVDKAAFFNNAFDQEFLLSNTMSHKQFQTMDEERERQFELDHPKKTADK